MILYFKEHKNVFFTFLVLVFLFYGNSLKNKYALDDDYITVTNFPEKGKEFNPNHKLVSKGFKGIAKIWRSRYAHDSEGSFDYRPVTTTTFAIEYGIFGQNPFVSHLINLLLYFITVWLLFCILLNLFEDYKVKFDLAFITAFIFLIHPIHSEVVNNLKCRDELLAFLFGISALWYGLEAIKKPNMKNIVLIILLLTLGLLSKRNTILFFAVIPLCYLLFRKVNFKIILTCALSVIFIYYLAVLVRNRLVTEKAIRFFYHFENPLYTDHVSFFQKIIVGIKTLGFYVKFLIMPYPFRNYYGFNTFDVTTSLNVYFFIGTGFLTSAGYFIYKLRNKILLFSVLLFLGLIVPFLNVGIPAPGILGERFAYFASFGFALVIAFVFTHYFHTINFKTISSLFSKPLIYITVLSVVFMIYSWDRNTDWYNKLTLFEADIKHQEHSAKANSLLANEYFEMLRLPNKKYPNNILVQKCIKHYTQAIKNDSTLYSAYNNVGVVYYSYLNDIANAKKYFSLAITKRPKYSQAYENLGNCYKQEKNIKKSYECYTKAIRYNPKQFTAFSAAIDLFFGQKEYDKSLHVIKIAQQNFPDNYELIAQEANCNLMKKDTLSAIEKYKEAYALTPNPNLAQYIAKKYMEIGDTVNAKKYQY